MEEIKTIETDRLILRRITLDDAEEIFQIAKDPDVGPRAGWKPHADVEETKDVIKNVFLKDGSDCFALTLKENGKIVGITAIEGDRFRPDANSGELGYWLSKDYWGNGLMTESAKGMIRYAFEDRRLDQLGICTSPTNERSQGVIKKCGFTYEGTIRRTYKIYNGELRDSLVFSITKEEYEKLYK